MNYEKLYYRLILKRRFLPLKKVRQYDPSYIYTEEHHIIPKSIGGSDEKTNLVLLTAKEHFIAHLLLVKIYEKTGNKTGYFKMCKALSFFTCQSKDGQSRIDILNCRIHSKLFAKLCQIGRKHAGKLTSKRLKIEQLGKKWITNGKTNHFLKPKDAEEFLKNNPGWRYGQKFVHRSCSEQAKANRLEGMRKSSIYKNRCKDRFKNRKWIMMYNPKTLQCTSCPKEKQKEFEELGFIRGSTTHMFRSKS